MTVARTARRRRLQAVQGYRHMARIGRGNNNRPYYTRHTKEYYERHEAMTRETRIAMQGRKKKK